MCGLTRTRPIHARTAALRLQPLANYRFLRGTSEVAGTDDAKMLTGLKVGQAFPPHKKTVCVCVCVCVHGTHSCLMG
jgi:hypothetical protein